MVERKKKKELDLQMGWVESCVCKFLLSWREQ
jgi:hypothetical protein